MIRFIFLFNLALLKTISSQTQNTLVTPITANQAVQIITGNSVQISNISFQGDLSQLSSFTAFGNSVGINNGILLTTGNRNVASSNWGSGVSEQPVYSGINDMDLNLLSGQSSIDAAILSFTFIPEQDNIEFEYVFSSSEYGCYVGSQYNDVFGFFVNGPNITGPYSNTSSNIATINNIPNGIPVSVNTINVCVNQNYYVHNFHSGITNCNANCPSGNVPMSNFNNLFSNLTYLPYYGRTKVMKARLVNLNCGSPHNIKIAISNINDRRVPSAVFIKAGSFISVAMSDVGQISVNKNPACDTDILNFSVTGNSNYIYTWNNGMSGQNITIPASQLNNPLIVTVSDPNSCAEVTRQITVPVHPADNNPPYTTGVDETGEFFVFARENSNLNFYIQSEDNPNEIVTMAYNQELPFSNINIDFLPSTPPNRHHRGIFTWNNITYPRGIHPFSVTVTDNNACQVKSQTDDYDLHIICKQCEMDVLYQNRQPNNNPVPSYTKAARYIRVGKDVNPNTTQGNVIIPQGAEVVFKAGLDIILEDGFENYGELVTIIDPTTCIIDCEDCARDWSGFTLDLPLPQVFTPNGDGVNDYWFVKDSNNPLCAFGANRFSLEIRNRWGLLVWKLEERNNNCCPFTSPDHPDYPNLQHSDIYWDGKWNQGMSAGNYVIADTYNYTLELYSPTGQQQGYSGTINVFY